MSTVALSVFHPYIALEVTGASDPLIDQAITDAAIEFCERSLIWRQKLDPIQIIANVPDYDVAVPAASMLSDVLDAELASGGWLDPVNLATTQAERAAVNTIPPRKGEAAGYLMTDAEEGTLTVDPVPVKSDTLTLIAALKPARGASTLPNFLYQRWAEAIAAGAKMRLMRIPDKTFSNANAAMYYQGMFNDRISSAAMRAARANTRMPLRAATISKIA